MKRKLKFKIAAYIALLLLWSVGAALAKPNEDDFGTIPNKCATFASPERRNQIAKTIEFVDSLGRPICQAQFHSPNGKFLIHYDTSGVHAVNLTDKNHNSIPDYVDSVAYYFEYVAQFYNNLRMPSPYPDDGGGGDSCYDVYLKNIGDADVQPVGGVLDPGGVYGWTIPSKDINSGVPVRSLTYIIIDNDFSPLDTARVPYEKPRKAFRETGILGMKITAAHEYFHAIQFYYGIEEYTGRMLAEMLSVYMEYTIFPESRDHVQYVNKMLNMMSHDPQYSQEANDIFFGHPSALTGYAYSIFIKYITMKYGEESLSKILEIMSKDNLTTYETFDRFFKTKGSNLNDAFLDFAPYMYYTGERAREGYLPLAKEYVTLKPVATFNYKDAEISYSNIIKPYEVYYFRYNFIKSNDFTNDTLDLLITDLDKDSPNHYDYFNRTNYTSIVAPAVSGAEGDPLFNYDPPKQLLTVTSDNGLVKYIKIEGQGIEIGNVAATFPSPVQLNSDLFVYFPVPEKVKPFTVCNLIIRDLSGATIYSHDYKAGVYEGKKAILLETKELRDAISTGVYIFSVESGDDRLLGKMAVGGK